jgi:hypothetical protein
MDRPVIQFDDRQMVQATQGPSDIELAHESCIQQMLRYVEKWILVGQLFFGDQAGSH